MRYSAMPSNWIELYQPIMSDSYEYIHALVLSIQIGN